jgi:hypothetical protein
LTAAISHAFTICATKVIAELGMQACSTRWINKHSESCSTEGTVEKAHFRHCERRKSAEADERSAAIYPPENQIATARHPPAADNLHLAMTIPGFFNKP